MGFMKQWLMEQQAQGYYYVGDKYVCTNCFTDHAIHKFIKQNAYKDACDYCGSSSPGKPIAAPIDDVIRLIVEGLQSEWGDPDYEGVPYETAEGGYQGRVIDSYDLLFYELDLLTNMDNEGLVQDLLKSIGHRQWCQKNFYSLPPDEALLFAWEEFSKQVKHHIRYVFFRTPNPQEEFPSYEEVPPVQILDRLGNIVSQVGLVRTIEKGASVVRVRIHEPTVSFTTAAELGSPPCEKARFSNRMSPAGISMFYGAFDEETALQETYRKKEGNPPVATIATFKTLQPFKVVDLTKLPAVPSLFDSEQRLLRAGLIFLNAFVRDISRPIEKDGREHIECVPTQIVTEYFRHIYSQEDDETVRGILYPSSVKENGIACVLFFENEHCCDADEPEDPAKNKDRWLMLDKESIIIKDLNAFI